MFPEAKEETIVAQASAQGKAGVGVIRVSGAEVKNIINQIIGKLPAPRIAEYSRFKANDHSIIDIGLTLFFPHPHSFTGEDVVEFHTHGSPVVMDQLIARVIELGARLARPGEFSERAFLNNKIDLTQAEAVADLIDATSQQSARAALQSLQGVFSTLIHELLQQLIHLRVYVEAAIDFTEEEIDFLTEGNVKEKLQQLLNQTEKIQQSAHQGSLLREGITVVIAGEPNAGKSSLLNVLSERDSAIVTDIPGTTRDLLREHIQIDGMPLHIIDTAGLRDSVDPVEQEGIKRARLAIENADLVLLIVDATQKQTTLSITHPQLITVYNKIDLTGEKPSADKDNIKVSVKTGAGIDVLKKYIKDVVGFTGEHEGIFSARRRHLEALTKAHRAIESALGQKAPELIAEDLRQAQHALNEITGEFTTDDLLGNIFSSFCVGK